LEIRNVEAKLMPLEAEDSRKTEKEENKL